jgi:23S rRNA pseudouridine2605 synthase
MEKKPRKSAAKPRTPKTKSAKAVPEVAPENLPETPVEAAAPVVEDPIGDVLDGEGQTLLTDDSAPREYPSIEDEAPEADASADSTEDESDEEADEPFVPLTRPAGKQERLQKILAQAGVASRRKAEEMIEQGRVQVNGTTVTELGTKADAGRDHIRVDGKLLHGAERQRYFILNKPRGFVTTVKDPEGRPTVMQFFEKNRERLYPVGRLDYMSEGLLLVTNDGDLANRLTKAGSGVEKTYLVKVAGQPTEDELDLLRGGVNIERGKPGSPMVRTSPARIRQVRQGDNPWFEVVLIEGRNRELRKMFVAVGHFVEKIRRVGYGPLVLDLEPGKMRELEPEELTKLRLAAEGKLKTPKSKEVRRRNRADAILPTLRPKPSPRRSDDRPPFNPKQFEAGTEAPSRAGEFRPKRTFGPAKPFDSRKPFRPAGATEGRPSEEGFRPSAGHSSAPRSGARPFTGRPASDRPFTKRPFAGKPGEKPFGRRPEGGAPAKPYADRPARAPFADRPKTFGDRPKPFGAGAKPFGDRPARAPFAGKPAFDKPAFKKPEWKKAGGSDRPPFKRSAPPAREKFPPEEDLTPTQPSRLRIDPVEPDFAEPRRPSAPRANQSRPPFERSESAKPAYGKPRSDRAPFARDDARPARSSDSRPGRPTGGKPAFDRSGPRSTDSGRAGSGRSSYGRPDPRRSESGRSSSGKPSFGGPRFQKPGFDSDAPRRSSAPGGSNSRPSFGARPSSGPRPDSRSSSGPSKPRTGGFSRPKPGGFSKPGFKSGPKKSKPGAKKHAGRHPGKKRG